MLVLSSDLIDAMKYLFGYNGYLANVAMMAIIEISAMLAIISRNSGAFKLKVQIVKTEFFIKGSQFFL